MADEITIVVPKGKKRLSERDAMIFALRSLGTSYDAIARGTDVGKVRCRQIVKQLMDEGYRIDQKTTGKVVH